MVLPSSSLDAPPGEDWLRSLTTALKLSSAAVLLRIEDADDARLGELVGALLPDYAELDVQLSAQSALSVPEGSTYIYAPSLRDAEWLNVNRPVFQRRGLRVILWCDAEATRLLPQLAPDFCDWISHSWPCPPATKRPMLSLVEAVHRLKQAGAKHPGSLAVQLDLDPEAIRGAVSLLHYQTPDTEIVKYLNANPDAPKGGESRYTASPFVVGAPLDCGTRAFVGRYEAITQIQNSLKLGQPVQLLGEPRMGKTSLLNQVSQWLPQGVPVAALSAHGHCGSSERELVGCIAEKLGKPEIALALRNGELASAASALEALVPCALLLDETDALTKPGHQFSPDFFDQCRALGQSKLLFFVCAARSDIEVRFQTQGLTSRFLNDSRRIWIGQLEPEAREQLLTLAPRLTREQCDVALEQAGGFALGLQWIADAFWYGTPTERAVDQLRLEMDRHFPTWWQGCSPGEQRLLRAAVHGVERGSLTGGERRSLRALVQRGLVEEGDTVFTVPGRVWREFVGEQ